MIVLNYHELVEDFPSNAWSLTRQTFESHIELCAGRLLSPASFLKDCRDPKANRTDAVLLSFDDGFLSDYTLAYGAYVQTGQIPGFVSFIPVDFVGTPGRMSWAMIQELGRNGIRIGSHGMAHVDLTAATEDELHRELTVSKAVLEDRLGQAVTLLAFPYGRFSRGVWEAALKVGYTHLFTIQLGYHGGFEPFLYSRLCLTNNMDREYMRRHLLDPEGMRGFAWRTSTRLRLYRPLMRWRYR
jgi:peptidoglycan/xylan/chitin deacetylase (PgdA/CDA1 family)